MNHSAPQNAVPLESPVSDFKYAALPCPLDTADDFLSTPTQGVIDTVATLAGPVLILGAAGKLGPTLALMLKKAALAANRPDLRIVAVSRFQTHRDRACFERAGIETLACDLSDEKQVRSLPDAPEIFFMAGVKFGTATSPELLEKNNVLAPRLVARRYKHSRIVVFSTGCVYPFMPVNSTGATEQTAPTPVGDYAYSCLLREEEFGAITREHGSTARTIFARLNYAVELRYGVLLDIATRVHSGQPVDVTTGHVNVIWQTDAIAQIIQSIAYAAHPAAPLNITGATVHRVRDIAEDFGKLFDKKPRFTGTEAPTAWLNEATRSHQLLGAPATPLSKMEQWTAAWIESNGPTWGKPTGFEKRDGNF